MKDLRWLTLFDIDEVHLTKDVGAMPYGACKYGGYSAYITIYRNKDKISIPEDVCGIELVTIKKRTGNFIIDAILFLVCHSYEYNVLNLYHPSIHSLVIMLIYKMCNKKGKVYIKCDCTARNHIRDCKGSIKLPLYRYLFRKCDVISVETKAGKECLENFYKRRILRIPNPLIHKISYRQFSDRENIILSVGRHGTPEKATEILIEAFCKACNSIPGWSLELVGPVDISFNNEIKNLYKKYPFEMQKVVFSGNIKNRDILFDKYCNAKIFCMPSRWEGFPLAFLEASSAGDFLIGTKLDGMSDITNNWEYGKCIDFDDIDDLSRCFVDCCNDSLLIETLSKKQYDFSWENFRLKKIIEDIDNEFYNHKSCEIHGEK